MATLIELTPREEVIRLVLGGRTNKALAAKISISEKPVQFPLNNIYTETGCERA